MEIAEVEECVELSTSMCNGDARLVGGKLVLIKGQGPGQGILKMRADGTLVFSDPNEETKGEYFIRRYHYPSRGVVCATFESEDHAGRYILAHPKAGDYKVSGMKPENPQDAYWRIVPYSSVTGNIMHYNRMNGNPWYCFKYWGDREYWKKGLFMVPEGTGKSANFVLKPIKDTKNGIFSITSLQ